MPIGFHRKPKDRATSSRRQRALDSNEKARAAADRSMDRSTMRPVVKDYENQSGSFMVRLARGLRGQTRKQATQQSIVVVQGSLRGWLDKTYTGLNDLMRLGARIILREGVSSAARTFSHVIEGASPLDSVTAAQRIVGARTTQLEDMRKRVFENAKNRTQLDISKRLQKVVAEGMPASEIVTQVGDALDGHLWEVERTVRTEASFAWNSAQSDGIQVISTEFPGVYQRWTEMVNDMTGKPYDNRVGKDSIAMHGQVARPGKAFTMPGARQAPTRMIGKSWFHPPNRPNDRAVLTPWMLDWGVPGWQYQGGLVIPL